MNFIPLVFDIDSAQSAFDALRHLDPTASDPQALEARAERDAGGALQHMQLDWIQADSDDQDTMHSILCTIRIDECRLTVEVKSRGRAERFQDIVRNKLAGHAALRAHEVQSVEEAMAASDAKPAPERPPSLQDDPEAMALVSDYLQKHYDDWVDTALPALEGRTPRRAVCDPDGREQVEALLQQAERGMLQQSWTVDTSLFRKVREQLGLEAADPDS